MIGPRKETAGVERAVWSRRRPVLWLLKLRTRKSHLGERRISADFSSKRIVSLTRPEVLKLAILVVAATSNLKGANGLLEIDVVGVGK